jgi:YD repeat-containing protein
MILTKELLTKVGACKQGINFCERNKLFGFDLEQFNQIQGDHLGFIDWCKYNIVDMAFEYDSMDRIVKRISYSHHNKGEGFVYEYNDKNQLVKFDDIRGVSHTYEYDSRGNKIKRESSNGDWVSFEYDCNNNKIKEIDNEGSSSYDYDKNNNLIYKQYRDNHKYRGHDYWIKWQYDSNNNKVCEDDSDGYWKTWEYDKNGNNTKKTYSQPDNYFFIWWYDDHNNRIAEQYCNNDIEYIPIAYYNDGQLKRYGNLTIPFFEKP